FLGQFATAEGKKGGQFYTPGHIVKTLVAILSPHNGRIYDPCCGSGGMFVQSEEFVKSHGGNIDDISVYGQESNPTTWRLAAMNLAIRGLSVDLGKTHGDTFANDQFPDLKFDYILANPPFNISDWGGEKYENDVRWKYGRPPIGNANYAWLQHILWKLKPNGMAGVVLANGALSSMVSNEGKIRKQLIIENRIESIISLPSKLFLNTGIPNSLWILSNNKNNKNNDILFVNANDLGKMISRKQRILEEKDIQKISTTISTWKQQKNYKDIIGFCKSVSIDEIANEGYYLTPARYVGHSEEIDDGIPFNEKLSKYTQELEKLQKEQEDTSNQISSFLNNLKFDD
ncbi:MAG: N-6 DNA methylase, partial [Flavobacteriaceae bacterium]|nr:N-6 DNA methylase [Flavobacteriaceae bacterium]